MSDINVKELRNLLDRTRDSRARRWMVDDSEPSIIMLPDKEGNDWDGRAIAHLQEDDFGLVEEDVAHLIVAAALPELLDHIEATR